MKTGQNKRSSTNNDLRHISHLLNKIYDLYFRFAYYPNRMGTTETIVRYMRVYKSSHYVKHIFISRPKGTFFSPNMIYRLWPKTQGTVLLTNIPLRLLLHSTISGTSGTRKSCIFLTNFKGFIISGMTFSS